MKEPLKIVRDVGQLLDHHVGKKYVLAYLNENDEVISGFGEELTEIEAVYLVEVIKEQRRDLFADD